MDSTKSTQISMEVKNCPAQVIITAKQQVELILKTSWQNYSLKKKQESVQYYFDNAMYEFFKVQSIHNTIKAIVGRPPFHYKQNLKASAEFMVYNMYLFLSLYSDLNGSWDTFCNELKDMSLLLWDIGKGTYALGLFYPVKSNEDWRQQYLDKKQRCVNYDYHKRQKYDSRNEGTED